MATIRKRGPYQWEARIRKKGYPTQSKTFETKKDAEQPPARKDLPPLPASPPLPGTLSCIFRWESSPF